MISMKPLSMLAMLTTCLVSAGSLLGQVSESQTDWSDGPGQSGPVEEWKSAFDNQTEIAWRSIGGQITLATPLRYAGNQHPIRANGEFQNCIAAGDLDGDRDDDLLTTDPVTDPFARTGAIHWWERISDGHWERHDVSLDFYGARYVDTADVDRDGDLDVIAAAYYGDDEGLGRDGRFSWFENLNGDATEWQQHLVGEYFWGANHIDAGDFDGDGDIDLVGASELTDGIYEQDGDLVWFENLDLDGDSWQLHELATDFPNASHAQAVDLDLDGDLDIAAGHSNPYGRSNLYWWENNLGDGTSWTKRELPGQFWGSGYLDVGDIDNDGDIDVIGGGYGTGALFWWENRDGEGTEWIPRTVGVFLNGFVVQLIDIDGDGDLDAAGAGNNSNLWGSFWTYENRWKENGTWRVQQLKADSGANPWMTMSDVNGDGRLDMAASAEDPYRYEDFDLSWWDISTFASSGSLTSSILDGGTDPQWDAIEWDANVRGHSQLTVEVRASDDADNLGDFVTAPMSGSDLSDLIDPSSRYFQYRISMQRGDDDTSPILREIHVGPVGSTGLHLSPPTPGIAGEMNELTAQFSESDIQIIFAYSLKRGTTNLPGCSGVALDLAKPKIVGKAMTNDTGIASTQFFVPDQAAGRQVHFQVLTLDRCTQSNVVSHRFQ